MEGFLCVQTDLKNKVGHVTSKVGFLRKERRKEARASVRPRDAQRRRQNRAGPTLHIHPRGDFHKDASNQHILKRSPCTHPALTVMFRDVRAAHGWMKLPSAADRKAPPSSSASGSAVCGCREKQSRYKRREPRSSSTDSRPPPTRTKERFI